jgi:hypothetical protein
MVAVGRRRGPADSPDRSSTSTRPAIAAGEEHLAGHSRDLKQGSELRRVHQELPVARKRLNERHLPKAGWAHAHPPNCQKYKWGLGKMQQEIQPLRSESLKIAAQPAEPPVPYVDGEPGRALSADRTRSASTSASALQRARRNESTRLATHRRCVEPPPTGDASLTGHSLVTSTSRGASAWYRQRRRSEPRRSA